MSITKFIKNFRKNDLDTIKQLEAEIDETIPRVNNISNHKRGYSMDEDGKVIGLSLVDEGVKNKDLETIKELTNLTYLNLYENSIQDISALQELTNLKYLNLCLNDDIKHVAPLQGLTNLTYLNVSFNRIRDISTLQNLTNLTSLDLADNKIEDISFLSRLTNLTSLILWDNQLQDISSLAKLTNLEQLSVGSNDIQDISPLQGLTNLNKLTLAYNKITDATPIKNLILNQKENNKSVIEISSGAYCAYYSNEEAATLGSNPLITPPMEVVAQGTEAFLQWFKD